MKNLNKICLKQKYWGYCSKCNQENKLQELIDFLRYPFLLKYYYKI
ncbi:hypothetical protein SMSE_01390 [Spiroplasma poulsonii]|nr:hypothetical protein SMSE_01390 [Spiroplasma poulsonii]